MVARARLLGEVCSTFGTVGRLAEFGVGNGPGLGGEIPLGASISNLTGAEPFVAERFLLGSLSDAGWPDPALKVGVRWAARLRDWVGEDGGPPGEPRPAELSADSVLIELGLVGVEACIGCWRVMCQFECVFRLERADLARRGP